MWMPSHNGGTSAAANEAQDSSPSIRQEGLKPAAKDPWAQLRKLSCAHPSYAVFPLVLVLSPLLPFL